MPALPENCATLLHMRPMHHIHEAPFAPLAGAEPTMVEVLTLTFQLFLVMGLLNFVVANP